MQITPGASALQTLKAQQAWEARRAAKTQAPEVEQMIPAAAPASPKAPSTQPVLENMSLDNSSAALPANSPQWSRKVQDIQNTAAKAGFLGVSEQDIRRAYVQGDSLLADYRV
jgi:hypothetical protein